MNILPDSIVTVSYTHLKEGIVITVSSDTAHQIDPDTGAVIVEVEQPNDEQVGSLTLTKTGEQLSLIHISGLLSHDKGRTFHTILSTLSELGYGVEWNCLLYTSRCV